MLHYKLSTTQGNISLCKKREILDIVEDFSKHMRIIFEAKRIYKIDIKIIYL